MAGYIKHHTAADATFSTTGATEWERAHDLIEGGGTTLGVGTIADGKFVKRVGTDLVGVASPSDVVYAASPNTDFDLTNGGAGGAVTIVSQAVAGIAAGDRVSIELAYTINNNTGGVRTYQLTHSLGSLSCRTSSAISVGTSATSREVSGGTISLFAVSAANLAYAITSDPATSAIAAGNGAGNNPLAGWATTVADLTGSQTYTFTVTSNAVTSSQTLTLHSIVIRKVSAT